MKTLSELVKHLALAAALVTATPAGAVTLGADVFWGEFVPGNISTLSHLNTLSATEAIQTINTDINGVTYQAIGRSRLEAGGFTLGVASSLQGTDAMTPFGMAAGATGVAGYADNIVVTSATASGAGNLLFSMTYHGVFSIARQPDEFTLTNAFGGVCKASGCLNSSPNLSTVLLGSLGAPGVDEVEDTVIIGAIPFTYNVPLDFTFYLLSNAIFARTPGGGPFNVSADFLNTATLAPIGVYDAAGNRDITATVNSTTSGIVYNTVVPEPATWAMLILGFATAGAAIRRRRSTDRSGAG